MIVNTNTDYPTVSDDSSTQLQYVAARERGESHNMAMIVATRRAPALRTGTRWLSRVEDPNPSFAKRQQERARAAGMSVDGKKFLSQLANGPDDLEAWVSDDTEVRRLCEKRGWGVAGLPGKETMPVVPEEPDSPYEPAEDLVQAEVEGLTAGRKSAQRN